MTTHGSYIVTTTIPPVTQMPLNEPTGAFHHPPPELRVSLTYSNSVNDPILPPLPDDPTFEQIAKHSAAKNNHRGFALAIASMTVCTWQRNVYEQIIEGAQKCIERIDDTARAKGEPLWPVRKHVPIRLPTEDDTLRNPDATIEYDIDPRSLDDSALRELICDWAQEQPAARNSVSFYHWRDAFDLLVRTLAERFAPQRVQ